MNQQVKIPITDQIQNAERRYYVALHQYSKAAKTSPPELAEQLRQELCDAFEELRAAHEKLVPGCD
jgi:hypothetical protein